SGAVGRAQRFEVTVEGRTHQVVVELDRGGQPVQVRVDDEPCTVQLGADDALRIGHDAGPALAVYLAPGRRPDHAVIGGHLLEVEVKSAREAALEAAMASSSGGATGGSISAPMPGRVVRVMVGEGDEVGLDAPLLIVEAMKMENEVRSPAAGVVRRVSVSAGDTVEAGQLLIELEPPATPA
ncbi:MAG: biotin/lipoyl-binding protein, partial [Myxococcales bacterium]|nr:biotin/lipoyl-binding protein [Myxococcales bacterium]